MNWWKRLSNRFRKYEKWIEIKVPKYLQNKEDDFLKDEEEMLDEIPKDIDELRREEE